MADEKPKCPECDTELVLIEGKNPEKCDKCGFVLAGFAGFERWLAAIEKKRTAKKKASAAKEGTGIFDALGKL